jgi:hypothetical protein
MGITANNKGSYQDQNTAGNEQESGQASDSPKAGENVIPSSEATGVYNEESGATPDPTAMTGTLDTSDVGPGPHEDLRNVTDTFNAADARAATDLEENDGAYPEVSDDAERQQAAETLRERSGTEEGEDALDAATTAKDNDPKAQSGEVPHAVNESGDGGSGDGDGGSKGSSSKGSYNPDEHTVPEVQKELDKADDKEFKRIVAAEKKGQARKGIVEYKK